ncbi:RNA polymerase sigma factor [Mucilaginibacter sp. E4BP6]|uniref:RNA polymerase sigma factor n=1 Tax=Mucilaginibacter sp. E4BP6 TaxID=2723089 RepID=UPI0015CC123A|nr:RNA polymerase sigma-70 factor [Mucilaginibacter sp. E4BP6]NYE65820.1 RNA polymerase sigma-70 factor (ECF subfamily) [Mucilaginibacter sp. E4BP6]
MVNFKTLNDYDLTALLREGNHAAYAELYHRYNQLLFVHAYKRLKDEEQAKDIVQEFFATLWTKRSSLYLKTSLVGYFFTSVNNRIIDHFLHKDVQKKYIASFAGFAASNNTKADHLIREKQLLLLIENEIQQLPPKMREIFQLSRQQYLSHKEIAEKLSISEKTVDRQISNALFRLKAKLGLVIFFAYFINF